MRRPSPKVAMSSIGQSYRITPLESVLAIAGRRESRLISLGLKRKMRAKVVVREGRSETCPTGYKNLQLDGTPY